MQIGTLVRGEINDLMGVVTDVMEWGTAEYVMIYWFEVELKSTGWLPTHDLEVICK